MAEFRVLGPVEASVEGEPIALPAAKDNDTYYVVRFFVISP